MMRDEYLAKARTTLAAAAMPDGEAYYQAMIEKFTTLDLTAQADPRHRPEGGRAHQGRDGGDEAAGGLHGDDGGVLHFLRTDPQFYAKTPRELLSYSAYVSKKADWKLAETIGTPAAPPARHPARCPTRSRRSTPADAAGSRRA